MIAHPNRSKINRPRKPVDKITRTAAQRVLAVVDAGLVNGLGEAKPGLMCVEAAVCYALGLPHGDKPSCVSPALRNLKIKLNDSNWSSDQARAKGLRRLALAQLGSAGFLDESEFIRRLCDLVLRKVVPGALRIAASVHPVDKHKVALIAAAEACENSPSAKTSREARQIAQEARAAADAAYDAAYDAADAADAAKSGARDKSLATFCEWVVQILIDMKAPGCQWLDLAEAA
jgi:hypothetical protein